MSKGPSPTLIGSFVLGALGLAAACAIYFGSISFASGNPVVVVFFDESVSGLLEGAKVKLRGVPIGTVKQIALQVEGQPPQNTRIPVLIECDLRAMRRLGSSTVPDDVKRFRLRIWEAIDQGLRARLQIESLITGLLFVELDFIEHAPPPTFVLDPAEAPYPEVPTIPSPFAALNEGVGDLMTRLAMIPVDDLSAQLLALVERLDAQMLAVEREDLIGDVSRALEGIDRQLNNPNIAEAIAQLDRTLKQVDRLIVRVEGAMDPLVSDAHQVVRHGAETLAEVRGGVQSLRQTSEDVQRLLAPESSLRYNIDGALTEIAAAAAAVERLADQLERNPRSLISGKAREEP